MVFAEFAPCVSHTSSWSSISTQGYAPSRSKSHVHKRHVHANSPWLLKCVLSLDGGGVRVLATLHILAALAQKISRIERQMNGESTIIEDLSPQATGNHYNDDGDNILLCHYFDYIGGTSTGGLAAILLGRHKMKVEKAIECFIEVWSKVLRPVPRGSLFQYSRKSKRTALAATMNGVCADKDDHVSNGYRSNFMRCRTVVFAMKSKTRKRGNMAVHAFRTYEDDSSIDSIAEVVEASVATTSRFKPEKLGSHTFLDAATSLNNPSFQMCEEVWGHQDNHPSYVNILLSIGCNGTNNTNASTDAESRNGVLRQSRCKADERMSALSDLGHAKIISRISAFKQLQYFRFDHMKGLQAIKSHDWKPAGSGMSTLATIAHASVRFLEDPKVQAQLEYCAQALVHSRRSRVPTPQWKGFAFGVCYRCKVDPCDRDYPDVIFQGREELVAHFELDHGMAPPHEGSVDEVERIVEQCKAEVA